jgi:hypothetical protein
MISRRPGLAVWDSPYVPIYTAAGNGSSGFSGDGGPAAAASGGPVSVAADGSNLVIADRANNRIRQVSG